MINKNDCLSLLVKLESKGVNINSYMRQLLLSKEVPLEVLRFISQNRGIEVSNFYEMLRKSHNKKKSPLYTNILKEDQTDIDELITTLSCLLTQVILYSRKIESRDAFLKEVRAEEITRALNAYFKDSDVSTAVALLKLVRSDLLVLEYISGRRELNA